MSYSAVFLPKAQQELLEAWEWYEDRQTGLGDRFKVQLFAKVNTILNNPEYYECKQKLYREAKLDVFLISLFIK
jgi:plasmid stabilization system protein ParE